jgi:hypothetical protein
LLEALPRSTSCTAADNSLGTGAPEIGIVNAGRRCARPQVGHRMAQRRQLVDEQRLQRITRMIRGNGDFHIDFPAGRFCCADALRNASHSARLRLYAPYVGNRQARQL